MKLAFKKILLSLPIIFFLCNLLPSDFLLKTFLFLGLHYHIFLNSIILSTCSSFMHCVFVSFYFQVLFMLSPFCFISTGAFIVILVFIFQPDLAARKWKGKVVQPRFHGSGRQVPKKSTSGKKKKKAGSGPDFFFLSGLQSVIPLKMKNNDIYTGTYIKMCLGEHRNAKKTGSFN